MSGSRFFHGAAFRNRAYLDTNSVIRQPRSELMLREVVLPINFADGTSEFPTNFKFPTNAIVFNTTVFVRTAEATGATKTLNVGTATADSGTPNVLLNGCDVSVTGMRGVENCQPIAITVGGSPFAYQAQGSQLVTVTGGTTTHMTLTRNGVTTADLATTTPFTIFLPDQDTLTVTYSVAPTMKAFPIPDPENYLLGGGKRLSWTPGSNDWANFDGDLIVDYYVLGDLTQFQTSGEQPEQGVGN